MVEVSWDLKVPPFKVGLGWRKPWDTKKGKSWFYHPELYCIVCFQFCFDVREGTRTRALTHSQIHPF